MGIKKKLVDFYDKKYKLLLVFSLAFLVFSLIVLGVNYAKTGDLFHKGVSLTGGITVTVPFTDGDVEDIENNLFSLFPGSDLSVRSITEAGRPVAIIIEASDVSSEELVSSLKKLKFDFNEDELSIESMGGSLGARFFQQITKALIFAFIAMALVIFITFKSVVPSSFVVLAAFSDIVCTLAITVLLGMKLSTAGIAAFLMLIGYSVDTDILLTTKVLKRKSEGGTVFERVLQALKPGLIMSCTSLIAASIGFIFSQSEVIRQIMLIIAIGLLVDMVMTWFQNAGILRMWMERKKK
jgi:preprotein translocase subunit SecF